MSGARTQRLSVVLCTYNGEAFLDDQLRSIARQSRAPDDVLIVDDVSSDATLDIARQFARNVAFPVEVVRNGRNVGFARNFGRGIQMARGDIIVLCDQDDVWLDTRLMRIEQAFNEMPTAALVFSDAEVVDASLKPLGYRLWEATRFSRAKQALAREGRMLDVLLRGSVVTGATAAFRSEYRALILPVAPGIEHDAWIALLLAAVAPVVAIPEALVLYRQHNNNQIGAKRRTLLERLRLSDRARLEGMESRRIQYRAVLGRLAAEGMASDKCHLFTDAIEHLSVRIALTERRLSRLGPAYRELMNGRYARYSGSIASICRDLLV